MDKETIYHNLEEFEMLLNFSLELSIETGINSQEIFHQALECYFTTGKLHKNQILCALLPDHMNISCDSVRLLKSPKVWLMIGETGNGKSTLTNTICNDDIAPEGHTCKSKTKDVEMYESEAEGIVIIDTPGFLDTDAKITDAEISKKIFQKVEERLKYSAKIDGILFMWAPTMNRKFRWKHTEKLAKIFGNDFLKSTVLLINKEANNWKPIHDELVERFLLDMKSDPENSVPHLIYDAKDYENLDSLKEFVSQVLPYRDDYFNLNRRKILLQKYQQRKQEAEEFKIKVDNAAKPVVEEMAKNIEKQEQEFQMRIAKMKQDSHENDLRHQRDLQYLKDRLRQLEADSINDAEKYKRLIEELKNANNTTLNSLKNEMRQTKRKESEEESSTPQVCFVLVDMKKFIQEELRERNRQITMKYGLPEGKYANCFSNQMRF